MASQRIDFQGFTKGKISQIYLGIDFGTSFSKVSYSYAPSNNPQIQTLKWSDEKDNEFFLPSVLYCADGRLYFEKPFDGGNFEEIKYFKYSVVDESLREHNHPETKCSFEAMCCVYFLAHVIKRSLEKIKTELQIGSLENIKVYVNMGVPLENFYEEENARSKDLYTEILESAVTLAGGSKVKATLPENCVLLENLDAVYSELAQKKVIFNDETWKVNVYPELAAELLLYHESPNTPDGIYAIVDIGGGTVDMALFQKETQMQTKNSHMYCIKQKILPCGIEILNLDDRKNDETIIKEFKESFSAMFYKLKDNAWVHLDKKRKIDVFFLGGGSENRWYRDNIATTEERIKSGGISGLNFQHLLEDFIKSDNFLIQKNQRLIISQMLARQPDDIKDVQGFPNFFECECPLPPLPPNECKDPEPDIWNNWEALK